MAIKEVLKNGFTQDLSQDTNSVIPAITDVVYGIQYPTSYPISDALVWDNTTYIPGGISDGSAKFTMDITRPTTTTSTLTGRVEMYTRYPHLSTDEDFYISLSYRFESNPYDNLDELIYQSHIGTGTPSFCLDRRRGNMHFKILMASGNENTMLFDVGPATPEVWHHFTIRIKYRDNEEGILTVWKDGKLARLYRPFEDVLWKVPTTSTPGINESFIAKPSMGYLAKTIIEDGQEVSVLDWRGVTTRVYPNTEKYNKWGFYKSSWGSSGVYDGEGNVNPGVYNPEDPLYVEPGNRIKTMWISNVKFELFGRVSNDVALRSLSPFGTLPEDFPDWYQPDMPISITYPTNGSYFSEGELINIDTDAEDGDVELLVNSNSVETKSIAPYVFQIQDIPINDALVDLPFDGNLIQWGASEANVILGRSQNTSYVSGIRGQSIQLFNGQPGNSNRSYLIIPNEGPLSEISSSFTISFWAKAPFGAGLNPRFLISRHEEGSGVTILPGSSDGRIQCNLYDPDGTTVFLRSSSSAIYNNEAFNHFAITYDGNWLKWYYNFELDTENEVGEINIMATTDWYINSIPNGTAAQDLTLDDLRIYNYAISDEDINKTALDNYLGEIELKIRKSGIESDPVTINIVEELPTFTITATATEGGQVTGSGEYEENEEVTLLATPDSGYDFVRWTEAGQEISTANPYIFNAEENRTLVAVFQQIEYQLTVTYTAGGTATGSGEYIAGSQVQLTATPNSGYSFTGWYRDITLLSTDNPYNYTTRGQADTVQVVFELIPIPEFTITVIPSTGGSVSGGGVYEEGQSVTLSAMPQSGWTFVKWSNDATDNPYSFTASENLTISAIFEEVNPEVPYITVKGKFKIV